MKVFVLTVLAAWGHFCVPSPQPPPTPTPKIEIEQQQRASETPTSNPTEQPTLRPTKDSEHTQSQGSKDGDKSAPDWWIVFLTAVLAVAAIVQVIWMIRQAGYMRESLQETRRATDAAKASADAAICAVEQTSVTKRAIVVLESVRIAPYEGIAPETVIIFTLKNFGETVAHSVKLTGDLKTLTWKDFLRDVPESTLAPQGSNQWITRSLAARIPDEVSYMITNMNKEEGELGYNIKVTYVDVFGKQHWHTSEGHYVPLLKAFINTSSSSD